MLSKLQTIGLVVTLLAGAALFAVVVDRHYAIGTWLFWRYARYWFTALFWAASCVSFGYWALAQLFPNGLPRFEQIMLGFAVGVVAFALSIFFIGLLGGLGWVVFFALPVAFLAIGWRRLVADLEPTFQSLDVRSILSLDMRWLPVLALGFVGVALLYFQLLSPETFSYDARWYHIPIAQRFALSGAVARFDEGLWFGAYPLLTSYLYTWAFLFPKAILFDRLELCAHIEFVVFLATLAQIPVLVKHLIPGAKVTLTWVGVFLFPQIYLYDSNLCVGADHLAAFFAIPIALAFWHAWHDFKPRNILLFSLFVSGAFLTKYTAISIILPPAAALLLRGLWLSLRDRRPVAWQALGVLVVAPIVITAPHWLKNWIWYGDPIFPMLRRYLAVRPWDPDAEIAIRTLEKIVQHAPRNLDGVGKALRATLTFSFDVHDWYVLHRDVPLFGSLFTLTMPCLLFVRGARRIWWLYVGSMTAVFIWYLLILQERYLQAVLPWMVAATTACVFRIWEAGRGARLALVPLVALQLIWGGDVPFLRTHNEIHDSSLRVVAQFLASGFEKVPDRFYVYEPFSTIGKTMPRDAVVLAHAMNRTLGIDRISILDACQTRFSYARLRTPAAIHRELTSLGVTHLLWSERSPEVDSFASHLSFLNYAVGYGLDQRTFSGYKVATLPAEPPREVKTDPRVALFGCGAPYRKGWYRLSQLTLPAVDPGPAPEPEENLDGVGAALERAEMIVVDTSCNSEIQPGPPFIFVTQEGSSQLYLRDKSPPADHHAPTKYDQ